MHELAHEFTSRKVSPWGGLKYFYGTYQKSGIREQLSRLPLPRPGSNRGYQPEDLIEAFMCSVVMGSRRLAHTGMLRSDAVVKEIFGWKRGMADQSTFSRFFKKQNSLLRFDSGFFSQKIMKLLEAQDKPIPYIIRGKMTPGIAQLIQQQTAWYANNDVVQGAEYCTTTFQASTWDQPRKVVIVRVPKSRKTHQPTLFEHINIFDSFEYKVFVTSVSFSAPVVHSLYNKRANAENRIKDLKYDYGIDGFSLMEFGAMEAAFRYVMMAYNLMAIFKQLVMRTAKGRMLSTIRFQCIAIGSYLVKRGSQKVMKLSAEGRRRHFLAHFFENLETLHPPFELTNA